VRPEQEIIACRVVIPNYGEQFITGRSGMFIDGEDGARQPAAVHDCARTGVRGEQLHVINVLNGKAVEFAGIVEKRIEADFAGGGLELTSYVRPGKLFTANEALMIETVGRLRAEQLRLILKAVAGLFEQRT
jgi:hypothetical protein